MPTLTFPCDDHGSTVTLADLEKCVTYPDVMMCDGCDGPKQILITVVFVKMLRSRGGNKIILSVSQVAGP